MSRLVCQLEDHPHPPSLTPHSPMVGFLTCAAETTSEMPKHLKKEVERLDESLTSGKESKVDKKALKEIEDWWVYGSAKEESSMRDGLGKALVSTTQAIDIINGGVKINALVSRS